MAELIVLGTAQDGGVPHAGCLCPTCRAAREDHRLRRLPAAVGIIDGDAWAMIDATSAFAEQLHRLWLHRPSAAAHNETRYGPPETVMLTHAHTGHYTGLWQLDRSVLAGRGVRVLAPPRTARFLAAQEPWRKMAEAGFIVLDKLTPGVPLALGSTVTVETVVVPHRAEWQTETVGVFVRGPRRSALYLPDIDRWDEWEHDVVEVVGSLDVALLDGTFWDQPTNPNVPHPPVLETMDRLQRVAESGTTEVVFTHLNHSNPVLAEGSAEAAEVRRRGFQVASEGQAFDL